MCIRGGFITPPGYMSISLHLKPSKTRSLQLKPYSGCTRRPIYVAFHEVHTVSKSVNKNGCYTHRPVT